MINFEKVLLDIVAEIPMKEFDKACKKAGIDEQMKHNVLELLAERGE